MLKEKPDVYAETISESHYVVSIHLTKYKVHMWILVKNDKLL